MSRRVIALGAAGAVGVVVLGYLYFKPAEVDIAREQARIASATSTALLAGGCFWCVEADFEKLPGVIAAVSGYAPLSAEAAAATDVTYENYAEHGMREVVEVTYDPSVVSYPNLVEWLIKHSDPTDAEGSFYDRGAEYSPAIYFANQTERDAASSVIEEIDGMGVYGEPIAVALVPRTMFAPAEEYHQDYYKKNPLKYAYYRNGSGRDAYIAALWGSESASLTVTEPPNTPAYSKPSADDLRARLSPMQYEVTQENRTEPPFDNEYWNTHEQGIYVDIVSGEPLFSSTHKFDSGTGWPSFTRPIDPSHIVLKEDRSLLVARTEVRSSLADSHLGHVFADAPAELGGIRYCINSAALRFVPVEAMDAEGYGEYLALFNE